MMRANCRETSWKVISSSSESFCEGPKEEEEKSLEFVALGKRWAKFSLLRRGEGFSIRS